MPSVPPLPEFPQLASMRSKKNVVVPFKQEDQRTCWGEEAELAEAARPPASHAQESSDPHAAPSAAPRAARPPKAPQASPSKTTGLEQSPTQTPRRTDEDGGSEPGGERTSQPSPRRRPTSAVSSVLAKARASAAISALKARATLPSPRRSPSTGRCESNAQHGGTSEYSPCTNAMQAKQSPSPGVARTPRRTPSQRDESVRAENRRIAEMGRSKAAAIVVDPEPETELEVLTRMLVEVAYEQPLSAEQVVTVIGICPEIGWLAQCAVSAPLPPGWQKHNDMYMNEETSQFTEGSPVLPQFGKLAKLALHARQTPNMASTAASWVILARDEAIGDGIRAQDGWTGPHVDPESGAEYWNCQATGMSSWESPSAAPTYIAHVADKLLQSDAFPRGSAEEAQSLLSVASEIHSARSSRQRPADRPQSARVSARSATSARKHDSDFDVAPVVAAPQPTSAANNDAAVAFAANNDAAVALANAAAAIAAAAASLAGAQQQQAQDASNPSSDMCAATRALVGAAASLTGSNESVVSTADNTPSIASTVVAGTATPTATPTGGAAPAQTFEIYSEGSDDDDEVEDCVGERWRPRPKGRPTVTPQTPEDKPFVHDEPTWGNAESAIFGGLDESGEDSDLGSPTGRNGDVDRQIQDMDVLMRQQTPRARKLTAKESTQAEAVSVPVPPAPLPPSGLLTTPSAPAAPPPSMDDSTVSAIDISHHHGIASSSASGSGGYGGNMRNIATAPSCPSAPIVPRLELSQSSAKPLPGPPSVAAASATGSNTSSAAGTAPAPPPPAPGALPPPTRAAAPAAPARPPNGVLPAAIAPSTPSAPSVAAAPAPPVSAPPSLAPEPPVPDKVASTTPTRGAHGKVGGA